LVCSPGVRGLQYNSPKLLVAAFDPVQAARLAADYAPGNIGKKEAGRSLEKTRVFVADVKEKLL
jgi:dihydrodipicolinate synthase/N-acetylneuraminate lyase